MHGRQGCLVACVWTAPSVGKGFQMHQTQPDVAHKYRTHRTQSPGQESQDATLLYQMQATFLLMEFTLYGPGPPDAQGARGVSGCNLFFLLMKTIRFWLADLWSHEDHLACISERDLSVSSET